MGCLFENLTTGKGKDGLPEDDIEKVGVQFTYFNYQVLKIFPIFTNVNLY